VVDRSTNPPDASPDDRLLTYAEQLASAIEAALPTWVESSVARVAEAWRPGSAAALAPGAVEAGRAASDDVAPRVRALLTADVDRQRTGPLDVCRSAVRYPTRVLLDAGVPPVVRDEFAVRVFPDDVYDLSPATFADLGAEVAEPGIVWGAAKAHVVMARRRSDGSR
jgi:hypothetical protein